MLIKVSTVNLSTVVLARHCLGGFKRKCVRLNWVSIEYTCDQSDHSIYVKYRRLGNFQWQKFLSVKFLH